MDKKQTEALLEARHETYMEWGEPWPSCGPEGNKLDAHITMCATVHDCINMARLMAKKHGKPTMGNDYEFLLDFIAVHWATPIYPVTVARTEEILKKLRPDDPNDLSDATWVFLHEELLLNKEEQLILRLLQLHCDEYDDWETIAGRVVENVKAIEGQSFQIVKK